MFFHPSQNPPKPMYFILEDICSHRDGPKHQNIWMPKKRMHLKNGGPPPQNGIEKKGGNDDEPSGFGVITLYM